MLLSVVASLSTVELSVPLSTTESSVPLSIVELSATSSFSPSDPTLLSPSSLGFVSPSLRKIAYNRASLSNLSLATSSILSPLTSYAHPINSHPFMLAVGTVVQSSFSPFSISIELTPIIVAPSSVTLKNTFTVFTPFPPLPPLPVEGKAPVMSPKLQATIENIIAKTRNTAKNLFIISLLNCNKILQNHFSTLKHTLSTKKVPGQNFLSRHF